MEYMLRDTSCVYRLNAHTSSHAFRCASTFVYLRSDLFGAHSMCLTVCSLHIHWVGIIVCDCGRCGVIVAAVAALFPRSSLIALFSCPNYYQSPRTRVAHSLSPLFSPVFYSLSFNSMPDLRDACVVHQALLVALPLNRRPSPVSSACCATDEHDRHIICDRPLLCAYACSQV